MQLVVHMKLGFLPRGDSEQSVQLVWRHRPLHCVLAGPRLSKDSDKCVAVLIKQRMLIVSNDAVATLKTTSS